MDFYVFMFIVYYNNLLIDRYAIRTSTKDKFVKISIPYVQAYSASFA